jgi:hypothetical protein
MLLYYRLLLCVGFPPQTFNKTPTDEKATEGGGLGRNGTPLPVVGAPPGLVYVLALLSF